jgi:hypothetical protein
MFAKSNSGMKRIAGIFKFYLVQNPNLLGLNPKICLYIQKFPHGYLTAVLFIPKIDFASVLPSAARSVAEFSIR